MSTTKKMTIVNDPQIEVLLRRCASEFRLQVETPDEPAVAGRRAAIIRNAVAAAAITSPTAASHHPRFWTPQLLPVSGPRLQFAGAVMAAMSIAAFALLLRSPAPPQIPTAGVVTAQAAGPEEEEMPSTLTEFDEEYSTEAREVLAQGLSLEQLLAADSEYTVEDDPATDDYSTEAITYEDDIYDT